MNFSPGTLSLVPAGLLRPSSPEGCSAGLAPHTCARWAQEGGEAASPAGEAEAWKGARAVLHTRGGAVPPSQGQRGKWPGR